MDTPGANIPFPKANAGLVSRQVRCVSYGISFSNDGHTQEGRRNAGDGQARARVLSNRASSSAWSLSARSLPSAAAKAFMVGP